MGRLISHGRANLVASKDAAALCEHQLDEPQERPAALHPEQLLDVAGPVGIEPLLKPALGSFVREKERRQPAVAEPVIDTARAELLLVPDGHRRQTEIALAVGERVAESPRGAEGRRPRGDDAGLRMVVRGDLQQLGGIAQALDLVDHDPPAGDVPEKPLRVLQRPPRARQLAIEVLDVGQGPAQEGLADPADSRQPDH